MNKSKITELAKGNPGALIVCTYMERIYGQKALDAIEKKGIRGSDIWYFYTQECNQKYDTMMERLEHEEEH